MNAIVETPDGIQISKSIDIDGLVPSQSQFQIRRRKRFIKAALEELAGTIKTVGLLEPIVVRVGPVKTAKGKYEIVAGERRWLACKIAGLKKVDVIIRDLTDEQAISVQVIENLHRVDPHPLEEAEGYAELIEIEKRKGTKAPVEKVAEAVNKSVSYVYLRKQLLELHEKIRDAFFAGKCSLSTAGFLCRIPVHELQVECLKVIADREEYDGKMTEREIENLIREEFSTTLKGAPFDPADATLCPKAGACGPCAKRTGNNRDLFGFIKGDEVCMDRICFAEKKQAAALRRVAELEKSGRKVIKGAEAANIIRQDPYDRGRVQVGGGYNSLDDHCHDDPKNRSVREIVAKNPELVEVVQGPKGQIVEVVQRSKLTELLAERGVKTEGQKRAAQAKQTRARNAQDEINEQIHRRTIAAVYKKQTGKLALADLDLIASYVIELHNGSAGYGDDQDDRIAQALGVKESQFANLENYAGKLKKPEDFNRLLFLMALTFTDFDHDLPAIAKRYKVDAAKIKRDYLAELKAKEKTKAAPKSTKGK